MLTLLAILHVIIGIGLVIFVLLQDPKGGGAGGMFGGGGGSNSVFGATGAGNFLTATTKWFAIFFAVSCLALTCVSTTNQQKGSVLDTGELPESTNMVPIEEGSTPGAPQPEEVPAEGAPPETLPATPGAPQPSTPEEVPAQ